MISTLLRSLMLVGTIGFGGGSALIPIIERELVDRRKLLRETQYARHTIVANITPGALPVKLAASAGVTVGGPIVAVLAAFVVALPGVVGTLALIALSDFLGPNAVHVVSSASVGITIFIVVLLLGYIMKVHANAGNELLLFVVITAVAAILTGSGPILRVLASAIGHDMTWKPPQIDAVTLILGSLVLIALFSAIRARGRDPISPIPEPTPTSALQPALRACVAFVVVTLVGVATFAMLNPNGLRIGALIALSSITSFGGGEAYIAVADGYFVQPGYVDAGTFYTQLVPIANALPGPILVKVAAGIGYLTGASTGPAASWLLALAATIVSAGACCALAMPVLGAYVTMRRNPIVVGIGRYILPVICGLLVSVSATMLEVSTEVGRRAGIAPPVMLIVAVVAIAVMTCLHLRKVVPDLVMLLTAGAVSLLIIELLSRT
ncbi:chromate transporter [uncultured Tessaracoccus sp.]|uniref:chromate transporter n=1 Tax=uncultured Tessaracoccus sp. TaxID=905023 RepID=UPI0026032593|nr:chromate transporter [uncultured Tessaracoccus sp.]